MSVRFPQGTVLHRPGGWCHQSWRPKSWMNICVIGLLLGVCGGVWVAYPAHGQKIDGAGHGFSEHGEQIAAPESSAPEPLTHQFDHQSHRQPPLAIPLLLLGCGVGSLATVAIAHLLKRQSPPPPVPPSPSPSSTIDLSQFKASDVPLTRHQREILQCLWLMAAIAPHASHPISPPSDDHFHASSTWEWCIEQIQSSAIARDELSHLLTDMGFSPQTVRTAWQIATTLRQ